MKFVRFEELNSETANRVVEQSIHDRPRVHIEPVTFGSEGDPNARLVALHLQVGDEHAVLTLEDVEHFIHALNGAVVKLLQWKANDAKREKQ